MMKQVLVVGGGGREHAIVDALSRSPQVGKIFCAPGNAGIAEQAECVQIRDTDVDALLAFAQANSIDLTVVGPEVALAVGIVDAFRAAGLAIFGHTQAATQIESSKEFAKEIMASAAVPTAAYQTFDNYEAAWAYTKEKMLCPTVSEANDPVSCSEQSERSCVQHEQPLVLKYDGLAAGKGVVVAMNLEEADAALQDMLLNDAFGKGRVVIEDYLTGPEFSFMCFVSGNQVVPMPLAQDHKRAYDGDKGPNTGGMGAYTPLPFISDEETTWALQHILQPVADAMVERGLPLSGVLYGGLMKTPTGVQVIEFNARFGDPETEVILPLLKSDIYDIFYAVATGGVLPALEWEQQAILGVVLASKGYPGSYNKGCAITTNGEWLTANGSLLYHMGTKMVDGALLTNGGRVLMAIAKADTIEAARAKVYGCIENIQCDNLFYRTDIAHYVVK